MSANLFNNRGGRRTKQQHVPEDHEGFALAVALVMNLVKHTDATHPHAAVLRYHRPTLSTTWRVSVSLLAAIMKLSAHMCGLVERIRGPRYDCFGP